ncbi:MAG: IS110 family transposase, partial [Sulfobacillus thermosulfidooxidans]
IAVYAILRTPGAVYEDLGATYFDQRDPQALVRREIRRLEALGYRVRVEPTSEAG